MPRFVLLYHDCPPNYERSSHWDLMFEAGQSLRTWAIARVPGEWAALRSQTVSSYPDCPPVAHDNAVTAEQLADHRLEYLEIEGPLSGDRGQVTRVERGTYVGEMETPERWQLLLSGGVWSGQITLRRIAPGKPEWELTVEPAP